jgi:hypothetical protein
VNGRSSGNLIQTVSRSPPFSVFLKMRFLGLMYWDMWTEARHVVPVCSPKKRRVGTMHQINPHGRVIRSAGLSFA